MEIRGQRVQDVNGPSDIEPFSPPARCRGVRVHVQSVRSMLHSEISHWIVRRLGRWRNVRDEATIRPAESQLAIRVAIDLVALLVDSAVVTATQHDQIRERGGPAVSPVMDVMSLDER
jgi:hypothetical protein